LQSEYNKDKKEIGKQVEVPYPKPPLNNNPPSATRRSRRGRQQQQEDEEEGLWGERGAEVGGRWYGAFGGFGGTGIVLRL